MPVPCVNMNPAVQQALSNPSLSEAVMLAAIQAVDAAVAVLTGPELRFTFVNPAYQAFRATAPMLGQRFIEVFPEAIEIGAEKNLLAVLDSGTPWRLNRYYIATAASPSSWWSGEAIRVAASANAPASVVFFVRNVSETVRMEHALIASEQAMRLTNHKLHATLDSITDGVLTMNADWEYTLVSERAANIVGMTPQDMLGRNVWTVFPHAEGTLFYDGYHQAMRSGEPVHFEEYYPAPLDLWLECHCYPANGELTVYFRDVSERRRMDESVRKNSALIRAISDTSPDVIFAKDRDGRFQFANPATLGLLGKPLEQVLGRTDADFLSSEAALLVRENDRRIMASGEAEQVEEPVPTPSGEARIWLSRKVPYRDQDGMVIGLMGIARDITERKKMERELRDANDRKDEFLAMLAHELRNPLAPISTAAHILKIASGDPQRVTQASEIILRQVRHMTALVDDLLDVSRVTRGLVGVAKASVDVKSVVASAIEQARPLIDARNHALTTRMGSADPHVLGDRNRLVQVLANLLNNAAKFTPPNGQISLLVETCDSEVLISVSDNGNGMPPSLLPHVFDLFTQEKRTPDRAQGGLGLGLALVKSIMALHDGRVEANSDGVGQGSRFAIALPLLQTTD